MNDYIVTNNSFDGAGSLQDILNICEPPALITFSNSMEIYLEEPLVAKPGIMIDMTSGITIKNRGFILNPQFYPNLDYDQSFILNKPIFKDIRTVDGLMVLHNSKAEVYNFIYDNSGILDVEKESDECFSCVAGGKLYLKNGYISNIGKFCLAGNGDYSEDIDRNVFVHMDNVNITNFERRALYLRYGNALLENCNFTDWKYKGSKSFCLRSACNGVIDVKNTSFNQINISIFDGGFKNWFQIRDKTQNISDDYFSGGGAWKAIWTESGGKINLENCTKNKFWINI